MSAKPEVALDAAQVARCVKRIAHEIAERNSGATTLVLVGMLRRGARLADLALPEPLLARYSGPAFGVAGLRRLCGVPRRPLLCAPAKPIGLSGAALAKICYAFAAAGADIVKDDHGLADQAAAPFRDRVARCHDAVCEANARTGGHAIYIPNLARGGALEVKEGDWTPKRLVLLEFPSLEQAQRFEFFLIRQSDFSS